MNKGNILVTGGAGYIGSHVCKELFDKGYNPITYDNLILGHRWSVNWGPLEVGDINDESRLVEVINKYKPHAVMHFAAFSNVGESTVNPNKYYLNNVSGTINLLNVMSRANIKNLVFSSSAAIYGLPEMSLINEDHRKNPVNPYGKSKLIIEQIIKDYIDAGHIKSICLRYFNAAGADYKAKIGECHRPETHLIPLLMDVVLGLSKSITIFGNDYNTHDGTCVRDYIHVSDLANAHVLALNVLESGKHSGFYNLGIGRGFSVKDIIKSVEKITKSSIPIKIGARRIGDPDNLVSDYKLAHKDLKWKPNFEDIDEIVKTSWKWHQYLSDLNCR